MKKFWKKKKFIDWKFQVEKKKKNVKNILLQFMMRERKKKLFSVE